MADRTPHDASQRDDPDDPVSDGVSEPPADVGHSDADTQTQRNIEDDPPA